MCLLLPWHYSKMEEATGSQADRTDRWFRFRWRVWSVTVPVKGITSWDDTSQCALYLPECFRSPWCHFPVKCQYMPAHPSPLRSGSSSHQSLPSHLYTLTHTNTQLVIWLLLFDRLTQKSTKLAALSTGRCITSSVISSTQTWPRDWWLTPRQYHGWHDKWSDGWHPDTLISRQPWQPMDDKTLTCFLTPKRHMHAWIFKHVQCSMCHTYRNMEPFPSFSPWCSYVKVISLMLAHTHAHRHAHTQTPPHLPNPSFPRLISSLLSSKNDSGRYFHSLGRKTSRYIELSHKIGFKLYCSVKAALTSSYQTWHLECILRIPILLSSSHSALGWLTLLYILDALTGF